MAQTTTTIRVRRDTRDKINRLAEAAGLSAPELVGRLVDRADDQALFVAHADAYEALRRDEPDLLAEIEAEDAAWHASDLARPAAR